MPKRVGERKLSPDQTAMVADNLAMVNSALRRRHGPLVKTVGWDEAYSWACVVLCNAVRTFDPAKGALSTHFYFALNRQAVTFWEEIFARDVERPETDQFSTEPRHTIRYGARGFEQTLQDERDCSDGLIHRDELEPLLSVLNNNERWVVMLRSGLMDGYPYEFKQIGRVFGYTRSAAHQKYNTAIRKMKAAATNLTPATRTR